MKKIDWNTVLGIGCYGIILILILGGVTLEIIFRIEIIKFLANFVK